MENLRDYVLGLGADLVGFADLSSLPSENRLGLPHGISIAIALKASITSLIPKGASMEYYDEYNRLNAELDAISQRAYEYLTARGYRAVAQTVGFVQKQRSEKYPDNPAGPALLPHKTVAALSGLGWIGKNSLLITEKYGSAVRLTSVLTNAPLPVSKAAYKCLCGDCEACVRACPGAAIKNREWSPEADRDELIDFYACRETVISRGKALGIKNAACGICMAVCPYTKKYLKRCGL